MERRHGLNVPQTLEEACHPDRIALLVYDMQVGILGQIADGERVLAATVEAVRAARDSGVRTIFLRHVTLPTELIGASQLRMWRRWQGRGSVEAVVSPFPPGAPHAQVHPALEPTAAEAVFDKLTMSAFEGTPLDTVLRDCAISAVAITGVALEIGIEPTVRHAADLGYLPVLLADACGAGDAAAGERSLAALEFAGDAILTEVAAFAGALGGR